MGAFMVANADDMRFSGASVDLLYRIKQSAYRHATDRALEHAMHAGREVVTEADVLAGLRAALEEAASAELDSGDAQSPSPRSEAVAQPA